MSIKVEGGFVLIFVGLLILGIVKLLEITGVLWAYHQT